MIDNNLQLSLHNRIQKKPSAMQVYIFIEFTVINSYPIGRFHPKIDN